MVKELNPARLRELLHYDAETGVFTWLVRPANCMRVGDRAGYVDGSRGYEKIRVDGYQYKSHRLAWLYVHGAWPVGDTDHINGRKTDNRIENLREGSRSLNKQNTRGAYATNVTGFLGVNLDKRARKRKWMAQIMKDGKKVHLGRYETPEAAHDVYLKAKREIHEGCTI